MNNVQWPDFKFPPVNLYSLPKQKKDFAAERSN